jgi:hypothetical protein
VRVIDDQIVRLLNEAVNATDEGQRRVASALLRLVRSDRSDRAALEALAADLGKSWGPELRRYYWELCRKLKLCE